MIIKPERAPHPSLWCEGVSLLCKAHSCRADFSGFLRHSREGDRNQSKQRAPQRTLYSLQKASIFNSLQLFKQLNEEVSTSCGRREFLLSLRTPTLDTPSPPRGTRAGLGKGVFLAVSFEHILSSQSNF